MKKYVTIGGLLLCLYSYGQESLFSAINQHGYGTFDMHAQSFLMHRSKQAHADFGSNTATSMVFTLNYESPKIENFSLNFSYVQSIRLQEHGTILDNAARVLQNDSFKVLNNLSLHYNLKLLGLNDGTISVGRFPLDTEFMTTYPIRQKDQAYEGFLLNFPNIKNWSFKLGYLTKFSSWKSNPSNFRAISEVYLANENIARKQEFVEATYQNQKNPMRTTFYYNVANHLLHTAGISYQQQILSFKDVLNVHLKAKGMAQWNGDEAAQKNAVQGIQSGILGSYKTLNLEGGIFLITGKTTPGNIPLQNPFGAKIILSEPLIGTDSSYTKGSTSYYLESSYRFSKGKIYALYLHTNDGQNKVHDEMNIITSYNIHKKLISSIKVGLLNERFLNDSSQLLDIRLVINYAL